MAYMWSKELFFKECIIMLWLRFGNCSIWSITVLFSCMSRSGPVSTIGASLNHLCFTIWEMVSLLSASTTNMCRMRCSQSKKHEDWIKTTLNLISAKGGGLSKEAEAMPSWIHLDSPIFENWIPDLTFYLQFKNMPAK